MAYKKRYTDSNKWNDVWFLDLPNKYKLFWVWLLDNCDQAGIWEVSFKLAKFHIGEDLEPSEVKRILGKKIIEIEDGKKWFIPNFIFFQHGESLSKKNPALKQVFYFFDKYNLYKYIPYKVVKGGLKHLQSTLKGTTVGSKVKVIVKEKEKGKLKVEVKPHLFSNSKYFDNIELFVADFESNDKYKIFDARYYYESVKNWSDGDNKKKANWISTARNWALRDFKENKATLKSGQQTKSNTRGYVYDAEKWANI